MHLTGWPGGPPLLDGWPALAAASEVAELVADLARRRGRRIVVDAPEVLFGRAALAGWQRAGRTSAGGSCRLLEAVDGWLAVNLARPDDVDAVPAVVEAGDPAADPWRLLGEFAARSRAVVAAERCQLLGVPAAALGGPDTGFVEPVSVAVLGPARPRPAVPLVVDLSGLWAGPLCARLLGEAGARVVKVEAQPAARRCPARRPQVLRLVARRPRVGGARPHLRRGAWAPAPAPGAGRHRDRGVAASGALGAGRRRRRAGRPYRPHVGVDHGLRARGVRLRSSSPSATTRPWPVAWSPPTPPAPRSSVPTPSPTRSPACTPRLPRWRWRAAPSCRCRWRASRRTRWRGAERCGRRRVPPRSWRRAPAVGGAVGRRLAGGGPGAPRSAPRTARCRRAGPPHGGGARRAWCVSGPDEPTPDRPSGSDRPTRDRPTRDRPVTRPGGRRTAPGPGRRVG